MHTFTFNSCKRIVCESGSLSQLAALCTSTGMTKALVVTDEGIVAAGLLEQLTAVLKEEALPFEVFSGIVADPPESVVEAALAAARDSGADGIIGFGGGSSLDAAKLVALMACSGEKLSDIYGVDQVKGQRLPLVLVPTTSGTGSEVTPVAIVTTGEHTKTGVVSAQLLPDIALLDASLTLGLPPHITAATGVDAMVHAIEAFTSVHRKNLYADMLARQALELLAANISKVTHQGANLEARQAMLLGACMAGQAFANAPVAAVHALAYPLGGRYHIPHGLSNSLVLPEVMAFNAPEAAHCYADLAPHILGDNMLAGDALEKTQQLIEYFRALIVELGLPSRLREMKIPQDMLSTLAEDAMLQQRLLVNNPRTVEFEDALSIYKKAW